MASMEEKASRKFWRSPELMEMLIRFLDAATIEELGKAHEPIVEVLQGGLVWDKLIKKTCPRGESWDRTYFGHSDPYEWLKSKAEVKKADIQPLMNLLTMMEEPEHQIDKLLDLICTRFPIDNSRRYSLLDAEDKLVRKPEAVEVVFTRDLKSHMVSALGFLVLEEVEATLGSSQQTVHWLGLRDLEGILISSLATRILRQPGQLIKIELLEIELGMLQDAENLLVVLKHCEVLTTPLVGIFESNSRHMCAEAWAVLAKALELHPGKFAISSTRSALLKGKREDLKVIWEAVRSVEMTYSQAFISQGEVQIEKEEGWDRVEELLDMSEDQWKAEAQKDLEGEMEEEEEVEGDEDDLDGFIVYSDDGEEEEGEEEDDQDI